MKKSKTSKLKKGFDFISNMPDTVLELILQRLPRTEEVVRTSILSKRWRNLWTAVPYFPSIDVDCERVLNPFALFSKKKFIRFVSWCLADKTRDLDSFRLHSTLFKVTTVHKLIKAAIMRKVKSLDLKYTPVSWNEDIILPHYLISCDSLEVLRLSLYRWAFHFPDATSLRFRALRVLVLESVYCKDMNLVKEFLRLCPSLEELTLIDCSVNLLDNTCVSSAKLKTLIIRHCKDMYSPYGQISRKIDVRCPELVNFEFVGRTDAKILIERTDSLKKAVIFPDIVSGSKLSPKLGKIVCKLLAAISNVESLSINFYVIQCLNIARGGYECFPALFPNLLFPNLKTLEVTTSTDAFSMNVLIRFLKCSPNLECLNLIFQKENLGTDYWVLDKVTTRRIITRHLKRVMFLGFSREKQKLDIAQCLLEHENVLEEMSFSWCNELEYRRKSANMKNMLLNFCKASSTVKLISILEQ